MTSNHILSREGYLINKTFVSKNEINELKKELTVVPFDPFEFSKAKEKKFKVYKENDKFINIPKYYGIKRYGIPKLWDEHSGEKVKLKFTGKLRQKQKEIAKLSLNYLKKNDGGLLSLPCGFGKTILALYLASRLKVKTLVIVHKTFLLNQWKERAEEFTNARIGIIQRDVIDTDDKDIVIGMLQSIAKEKYDPDVFHDFGLVIFDEAHHAPSKYFSKALPIISCKKSLALTATPKRTDKLEKILYWFMGDIIYQAEKQTNKNVLVDYYQYDLGKDKFKEFVHRWTKKPMRSKTLTKLTQIDNRNKFIIKMIKKLLQNEKRVLLILSDRIEHLEILKQMLDKNETCTTGFYIGGMKEKQLKESAEKTVIFGTYGMASEALDIPRLNTLLMVTPRRKIEQSVGRILRKTDFECQPLIVDIVDNIDALVRQGNSRMTLYKKLKYQVHKKVVKNNKVTEQIELKDESSEDLNVEACNIGFID